MRRDAWIVLAAFAALLGCGARGATAAAGPAGGTVIRLYPGAAPGSEKSTQLEVRSTMWNEARVRNVTQPTLTAYVPKTGTATGAAVIVAPGGGFQFLSIESEGEWVARWLSDHGVVAFVLKYRLVETPADPAAFEAQMNRMFGTPVTQAQRDANNGSVGAQQGRADGIEAVRQVRKHASAYGLSPDRIGILGFSAGGMVALHAGTMYAAASRPDFVASVYGAMPAGDRVPDDAPPLFLAVAADDPVLAGDSTPVFSAWQAKSRSSELHIYSNGGHGFGLVHRGAPSDHWIDEFFWWMESHGFLGARP
jgi:acetyl esterase/lipase